MISLIGDRLRRVTATEGEWGERKKREAAGMLQSRGRVQLYGVEAMGMGAMKTKQTRISTPGTPSFGMRM